MNLTADEGCDVPWGYECRHEEDGVCLKTKQRIEDVKVCPILGKHFEKNNKFV